MRKFSDGLDATSSVLAGFEPENGALFLVTNKRRNRLQVIYHDRRTGICVVALRLAKGSVSRLLVSKAGASPPCPLHQRPLSSFSMASTSAARS